ncbi:hypothetical protein NPIL_310281 [Nephila pilipes]|uniref:Uncharacterized protein n=1 Tax=Nephila pilipes TaxID=299642 RepID=A0A8X6TRN0_NEPPI|nr:hypothetical protein NPIL_310281 [Nephila pilipes]
MRGTFWEISIRNDYYIPAPSSRWGQYEASRHCPCEVDALSHQLLKVFIRKCSRASTSLTSAEQSILVIDTPCPTTFGNGRNKRVFSVRTGSHGTKTEFFSLVADAGEVDVRS